jgi:hypothetical protein
MDWTIRAATAEDAPAIRALVRMLDDEEAKAGTPLTVDDVLVNGFGGAPRFRVLLAESGYRALGYVNRGQADHVCGQIRRKNRRVSSLIRSAPSGGRRPAQMKCS